MTNKIYQAHLTAITEKLLTYGNEQATEVAARASVQITLEEMEKYDEWKLKNGWDNASNGLWAKGLGTNKLTFKSTKDLIQDYLKTL